MDSKRIRHPFGFQAQKPQNHRANPFQNDEFDDTIALNLEDDFNIDQQNGAAFQPSQPNVKQSNGHFKINSAQNFQENSLNRSQETPKQITNPFTENQPSKQSRDKQLIKAPFARMEEEPLNGTVDLDQNQNNLNQNWEIDPENEPPLLEDLGIDLENIKQKWLSVLLLKKQSQKSQNEADMSGPLILVCILGAFLLMNGKIHFGFIYGQSVVGTILIYCIMNFLSQEKTIEIYNTMSILGYCLLPVVMLAFFAIFLNLKGIFGMLLSGIAIGWSSYCSTQSFDLLLDLNDRKWLVAYPVSLFYATFILITVF